MIENDICIGSASFFWIVLLNIINSTNEQPVVETIVFNYGNFKYTIYAQKRTFYEAEEICQSKHFGTLAKITNKNQQNYFTSQIEKRGVGGKYHNLVSIELR